MNNNILYIGDLWQGSTSLQRFLAIKELGYNAIAIDSTSNNYIFLIQKIYNLSYKIGYPIDLKSINDQIIIQINSNDFDICWIDKSLMIKSSTIKKIKHKVKYLIHYSPDDMLNPRNQTKYYLNSLKYFDLILTTKSFNVLELYELGAKNVKFVSNCYDHNLHKKINLTHSDFSKFHCNVGFIGAYEKDRFDHIFYLAKKGIKVKVFGKSWEKCKNLNQNLIVDTNDYYFEDYVKIINSIDINLCFLRKENRDLQTQRSVEIPACGKMMIAEKTIEHLLLFKEDEEAVYFENGNFEELYNKVIYFIKNNHFAKEIGNRALQRCIASGYSYINQIDKILKTINID